MKNSTQPSPEEIKKIAKETKNKELAKSLKNRLKNNNTVQKWQK